MNMWDGRAHGRRPDARSVSGSFVCGAPGPAARPRARLRWCCGFAVILVLSAPARAILSRSGLGAAYGPREASLEYFFDGLSETLVGAFFDVSNEL